LQEWVESGLFSREIQIYQDLTRRGVLVQFVTYGDSRDRQWEEALQGIRLIPVYERYTRPESTLRMFLQSFLIPWRMRSEFSEVDLFKTNQMMGAWVGIIAKLSFRRPLLVRCGYELSEFARLEKTNWWYRTSVWLLSFVAYHVANEVHLTTRVDSDTIRKRYCLSGAKITVRPNSVDTERFIPSARGNEKGVLFVGRIFDQKNLPLLVESLAGTNLELTIVGAGESDHRVRELVKKNRVVTHFQGRIPNSDLPKFYQECMVYVICSRFEGNPKTLLEAMACGCAVIGTDVPGINNIINPAKTGLLVPEDPLVLRAEILRLASDRNLRHELGAAARKSVIENHSINYAVQCELSAYNRLIRSRRDQE